MSNISIQRGCDGANVDETCDSRLELDIIGPATVADLQRVLRAWESTAGSLGWRREGAGHVIHAVKAEGDNGPVDVLIPSAKTWVTCPICSRKRGHRDLENENGSLDAVET